jgi:hypothetical protein
MAADVYTRGGLPVHLNGTTAVATVQKWTWNSVNPDRAGPANFIRFANVGTGPLTLSFTLEDATAGVGITLAAGAVVELPAEIDAFYTKSAAAQAFEAVLFIRRG